MGLSILSGVYNALVLAIVSELKECGVDKIFFFLGGIIFKGDVEVLKEYGVFVVFIFGVFLDSIVDVVLEIVELGEGVFL